MRRHRSDILVLFDGDQRPAAGFPIASDIPASKDNELGHLIKAATGVDVHFNTDGGPSNEVQLFAMRRAYLGWCNKHVSYLPGMGNREEFIWDNMTKDDIAKSLTEGNAKSKFVELTKLELKLVAFEQPQSKDVFETQKRHLASVTEDHSDLKSLVEMLRLFGSSSLS